MGPAMAQMAIWVGDQTEMGSSGLACYAVVPWWCFFFFLPMQMGGSTPTGPSGIGSVMKEDGQLDHDMCMPFHGECVILFSYPGI